MTVAIVASRIDADQRCRRVGISSWDFSLWHFENPDGTHEVHMLYLGGYQPAAITGHGDTFTSSLDAAMDNLRSRLPTEDSQ